MVAGATMISRLLGLWRDILITAVFGASALASAFYAAFTLPNLFRRLLGEGALTAAFVPTLSSELRERERAGAFALVNQVASWLLVVTGGIVAIAIALLPTAFQLGEGSELRAPLAATVIGGTSIFGGRGGFGGTILGALILTVLGTMLTLLDMPEGARRIIYGLIILAVTALYIRLTEKG